MNVLVTGGTGTLGRDVVMLLRHSGHRARILSRQPRGHVDAVQGDLKTGAGLTRALAGMEAIVHAASATRGPLAGRATDVRGTRRLLELAREANIGHVVYVSIVGIDGVAYPYYRIKVAAEAVIRHDIVPWSILRATQFHSFMVFALRAFARLPGIVAIPLAARGIKGGRAASGRRGARQARGHAAGFRWPGGPRLQKHRRVLARSSPGHTSADESAAAVQGKQAGRRRTAHVP